MFKIIPLTYTSDGRKVPIAEMKGWYENNLATYDQHIIAGWTNLYSHKIKLWGVPTGTTNGLLVLDVDVKDANANGFNTLASRGYSLPNTLTQTTKSGGRHYIYKYPEDGRRYGNRVSFAPGLDIRGEGGYIAYYGTDQHPISEAPSWLLEEALKDEKKEAVNPEHLVKVAYPIVVEILTSACDNIRNAPEGEANNVMNVEAYRVGQLLPSGSIDRETAYNALTEASKARGKTWQEAKATINSGLDGGAKSPYVSPFGNLAPVLTIQDLSPQIILDRWTPSFIQRHQLTDYTKLRKPQVFKDWSTEDIHITTADGGTGKTTLKLEEAICLAVGEDFLGFKCTAEGRTLFITGEDSDDKIKAMIGANMKQRGWFDGSPENEAKISKVLNNILVKKDIDLRLVERNQKGYIVPAKDALDKLIQAIEDLKPKLIVFDPIASFWGRESDLNDMTIAVAKFMGVLVEKSNACVEAINHMGKQSSTSKDMSQFAGRGGTGLPSHARVSRVLRPVFEEEFAELTGFELGEKSAIMCNVNKFSDGSPLYNKPFLIVREGYLFSRVTLVESKVKEEREKMDDNERVFTFIADERAQNKYPTKSIIELHFSQGTEKISKDRVKKALDFLSYNGHMGEKIKQIDNPDANGTSKTAFVIVDSKGVEV